MTVLDEVLPSVHPNIVLLAQQQRASQQKQSGNYHRSSGSNNGHEDGKATASTKKRKYSLITEDPLTRKRISFTMLNGGYKDLEGTTTSSSHHNSYLHHHSANLLAPQSSLAITTSSIASHHPPVIATLANLGNTCYMNSVLYALRFAPTFLHRLHHLVADLESACAGNLQQQQLLLQQRRLKSASLGRNVPPGLAGVAGNRSTSTRDLLAIGGAEVVSGIGGIGMPKTRVQIVTEKLHELFLAMRTIEDRKKDMNDAYQPIEFLEAIRNVNPGFEGNHQQDAHELLVYLMDYIRETCNLLHSYHTYPELTENYSNGSVPVTSTTPKSTNVTTSSSTNTTTTTTSTSTTSTKTAWWSMKTSKKSTAPSSKDAGKAADAGVKKEVIKEEVATSSGGEVDMGGGEDVGGDSGRSGGSTPIPEKKRYNKFLTEDFEGITLRRTKCLECESVTERKELFYDIPVPINCNEDEAERQRLNPSHVYRLACVTTEKLCDANKYLCEFCQHYNEASREVSFAKLPNILVLQLKRFATSAGSAGVVQKIFAYMPTPLKLSCFCEGCCREETDHKYRLCCVIMHLGGTLLSGHYIAYVRVQGGGCGDFSQEYANCSRDPPKGTMSVSTSEKSLNFLKRFKPTSKSAFESSKHSSSQHNQSPRICKSQQCCGIKINRVAVEGTIMNAVNANSGYCSHYDYESCDEEPTASAKGDDNDIWLECDDDSVRSVTKFELQKLLSGKVNPTSTPYVLFYAKIMPDA